ncbi:MAG: hypothetical protein LH654_09405 [Thermoleophilia bacterium]|nr:hypothetical protein [Thermoleophilia bacterium]
MAELKEIHDLYGRRGSESRASGDIVDVARAATFGAVDTLLVDIDEVVPGVIDEVVPGVIDEASGAVTFMDEADASGYGVVDEIARRVWLSGGRVLAAR